MPNFDATNDKRKCENASDKGSSEQNSPEFYDEKHLIQPNRRQRSLSNYFSKSKYVTSDEPTEDENESDISSTFSLQECMNEFRARRIRRTHLNQQRQNDIKETLGKNLREATEIDLINQNLCNKEQERKCKPCRNGFCYCFTSDSGDGGNQNRNQTLNGLQAKDTLSSRRSECRQSSNPSKTNLKNAQYKKESLGNNTPAYQAAFLKCTRRTNKLTAISSIEESTNNSPLIHIIHEIHDNTVISKVKFNKTKLQTFGTLISPNRKAEKAFTVLPKATESNTYSPTAPSIDLSDMKRDTARKSEPFMCSNFSENRRYSGGQLLQKRLLTQLRCKQKDLGEIKAGTCRTASSTDTSVRAAEQFLDSFLEIKGNKHNARTTLNQNKNSVNKLESAKSPKKIEVLKKDFCSVAKENVIPTCPSLSDIEEVKESQSKTERRESLTALKDGVIKEMDLGFNEAKIKAMLNYDSNTKQGVAKFHTSSYPAQAQHNPNKHIPKNERLIGWVPPHKINLDTVDGAVHHNLAANFIDKNTPVKGKITSQNQNLRGRTKEQNFVWSGKLKHLSPWSNKTNKNYNKNERKICSRSKAFITSSKTKLLDLISPRKDQRNAESKNFIHHFGVQTPPNESLQAKTDNNYQYESSPQSPPGSYNSPVQSSHMQYHNQCSSSINNSSKTEQADFDFSRTVHSPNKKVPRASQRKLDFPLNSTAAQDFNPLKDCEKKTYRSFNSELDQDLSISKINYILNNIRSKLEASDQRAVCTFQEAEPMVDQNSIGFDCPDNLQIDQNATTHRPLKTSKYSEYDGNEPLYSEIVDEDIYLSESPEVENHTSIQHYGPADNPDILYTKVNKRILDKKESHLKEPMQQPIPLGNIIMDSFRMKKLANNFIQPDTLPADKKHPSPLPCSSNSPLSHSRSLNNVRVMEQNAYPKKQRNLNKSDLSLQRSELFLENLCSNELIVNPDCSRKATEKVQNDKRNSSSHYEVASLSCPKDEVYVKPQCRQIPSDAGCAYNELPNDEIVSLSNDYVPVCTSDGSNLSLCKTTSPSSNHQSTLKKRSFVTKDEPITNESRASEETKYLYNVYQSTPLSQDNMRIATKQIQPRSLSTNEVSYSAAKNDLAMKKCKGFKNILRKSFRKSKTFVKEKGKMFSKSMNFATFTPNVTSGRQSGSDFDFNIEDLISFNESESINQQIARAVSVCRQLPDLEASMEMVEAERLLLFSSLRRRNDQNFSPAVKRNQITNQKPLMHIVVNEMHLPVLANVDHDKFFNFFYIVTFECGDVIVSSQSAECQNEVALFRVSGMEFTHSSELDAYTLKEMRQNVVKCNIFMLRLRKLSAAAIEQKKVHSSFNTVRTFLESRNNVPGDIFQLFNRCEDFVDEEKWNETSQTNENYISL